MIDDVSYSTGRHLFRAGVNYRYNPESDLQYASVAIPLARSFSPSSYLVS
jgi:hypothetical protein